MALKLIKNKILSTKKTGQVTKAMESVSAVKMRKSQERAFLGRPYVHSALRILSRLAKADHGMVHPFTTARTEGTVLAVIITSDKGLAGSVSSAVLKKAEAVLNNNGITEVVAVGRKAAEFVTREKKTTLATYTNISDGVELKDVYDMSTKLLEAFATNNYKKVVVIYQNFISTFEQVPVVRQVLPVIPAEINDLMRGIKPKTGKFSSDRLEPDIFVPYSVEPSPGQVLDTLVPQLVQIMLYHALLESKASEHSARMIAMKNATDKSKEMVKALTVKFNKQRQAAITAEVSEITAGVEAMK